MAVEICKKVVDEVGTCSVPILLASVEFCRGCCTSLLEIINSSGLDVDVSSFMCHGR